MVNLPKLWRCRKIIWRCRKQSPNSTQEKKLGPFKTHRAKPDTALYISEKNPNFELRLFYLTLGFATKSRSRSRSSQKCSNG